MRKTTCNYKSKGRPVIINITKNLSDLGIEYSVTIEKGMVTYRCDRPKSVVTLIDIINRLFERPLNISIQDGYIRLEGDITAGDNGLFWTKDNVDVNILKSCIYFNEYNHGIITHLGSNGFIYLQDLPSGEKTSAVSDYVNTSRYLPVLPRVITALYLVYNNITPKGLIVV